MTLVPFYLHPVQERHVDWLSGAPATRTPWRRILVSLRTRVSGDADDWLGFLFALQRLRKVFVAGLWHERGFYARAADIPGWESWTAPRASVALHASLADKLFNADPNRGDVPLILLGDGARRTGALLLERCVTRSVLPLIVFDDPVFDAALLAHADHAGVRALARDALTLMIPATTRVIARARESAAIPPADRPAADKKALYHAGLKRWRDKISGGRLHYTLTSLPHAAAARREGMRADDYTRLFFEMCDQPWEQIGRAQEHLIATLDRAQNLRFTNQDGTDLRMSIKGFTFCNSLIARNVPGSEVFSAPHRLSVEGTIVAKGRFIPPMGGGIIENIALHFTQGHLTSWHAENGQAIFEKTILVDEGARYVGEIGIGTNPHLKRHMADGLLVEKIGGSFHVALGASYEMTDYMGTPVHVDNGNRSALHWDITTMLYGAGGHIDADGTRIMENGIFLDPKLDILNRGWEAIPVSERPDYWRDFDFTRHRQRQS